jgi:phosphoserine phosphatase RsbU/P
MHWVMAEASILYLNSAPSLPKIDTLINTWVHWGKTSLMANMAPILIIDDDPVIQIVLKRTLQEQGYEVVTAESGEEGLRQAIAIYPALIICDWLMTGMDGLEFCRQVKAIPELSTTFFILLTSRSEIKDRVEGLDAGADDFLTKPIDVSELKARVRAGLRLYQSAEKMKLLAHDLHTQKQQLETELLEAAEYVRSLLPTPMHGSISVDSQFLPSRQLGGDCFDYFWLDADHLVIYLLDVSGHGLGAALPSAIVQNTLRSQSLPGLDFYQPASVLKALNQAFQMSERNSRYFTMWYGVYHRQHKMLTYSSAGHPPALLLVAGQPIQPLKTRGAPVGVLEDAVFANDTFPIETTSTLYIFSDGIYEFPVIPDGTMGDLNGFTATLLDLNACTDMPIHEMLSHIQSSSLTGRFEDDCSLIQVKFN